MSCDRRKFIEEVAIEVTKTYLDEGRLIEAGWAAFRAYCMAADATPVQVTEMRLAFMAGAEHLFASIMVGLESDGEPTADDLRRMDQIHIELAAFSTELQEHIRRPEGEKQ